MWQTDIAGIAVKIIGPLGNGISASGASNDLRRRLHSVTTLPLRGIKVARPESIIRQIIPGKNVGSVAPELCGGFVSTGYFMRFLDGMIPIGQLIPREQDNPKQKLSFLIKSGGLRRRFRVLARLAGEMAKLHDRSLVYVDLSPNNAFVSSSPKHWEAWLIDADNLHMEGASTTAVYTPGYGAPELSASTFAPSVPTDLFSLAVVIHEVLRWRLPFHGALTKLASDGWDAEGGGGEGLRQAEEGLLPWMDDPEDKSNRCDEALPVDLCAPTRTRLRSCFERAFGPGKKCPDARPPAVEWARALWAMADLCIICRECGGTLPALAHECAFCGCEFPHHLRVHVDWLDGSHRYFQSPNGSEKSCEPQAEKTMFEAWTHPVWDGVFTLEKDGSGTDDGDSQMEVAIPSRWIEPFCLDEVENEAMRVVIDSRRSLLTLFPLHERRVWTLGLKSGEIAPAGHKLRLQLPDCGPCNTALLVGKPGIHLDHNAALARVSFAVAGRTL